MVRPMGVFGPTRSQDLVVLSTEHGAPPFRLPPTGSKNLNQRRAAGRSMTHLPWKMTTPNPLVKSGRLCNWTFNSKPSLNYWVGASKEKRRSKCESPRGDVGYWHLA